MQITQINNTSIELSWVPGGNESSWNIKYNPIILGAQDTIISNISVSNYLVSGLDESTSYDFYVQSICDLNNSNWIGPFSSTTLDVNNLNSQKLYIYPNPNYKIFYVKSILEVNSIKILDILGKTIRILNPNRKIVEIDIKDSPAGIYFLSISLSNGSSFTKKIVCK